MKIAHFESRPLNVVCYGTVCIVHLIGNEFCSMFIENVTDENGIGLELGDQIKITEDPLNTIQRLKDFNYAWTIPHQELYFNRIGKKL
jgi:hypothetical protein